MEIYVDRYEHVDYLPQTERGSFEVFKTLNQRDYDRKSLRELKEMYERERNEVARAFVRNGWEGDGTLMCLWIPPFIDYKIEHGFGRYILHVKQWSNGTSFLGFINEPPTSAFRSLFNHTEYASKDY